MRLTVRVPATSANLGPGFDCFGLALDVCNEVTIDTDAASTISWQGEGARELPVDGSDLIHDAMRRAAGDRSLPPHAMRAVNEVPLASGLGSSSAAVVAGVAAGLALLGEDPAPERVFPLASAIEGHPDNAAPACFGGFTIAMPSGAVHRVDAHADVHPVVLVPMGARLETIRARAALPERVSLGDAIFNVAHAALAVEAFTRDPSLLAEALDDRLHERVRLDLVPQVRDVFDRLREQGVPVCVSGAGPSLLAIAAAGAPVPEPGDGWRVLAAPVRAAGFEIVAA